MKTCTTCNIELPLDSFRPSPKGKMGRHSKCRACDRARCREYHARNKAAAAQRNKQWATENRERKRELNRAWKAVNPVMKLACSSVSSGRVKRYSPPWLTKGQKHAIRAFYVAAITRSRETGERWEVDHIVPLNGETVCGLHVPWNLQVLHKSSNDLKGNTFNGIDGT